ncbi:MAG: CocE/NonD family hydrolase [Proteobacteria bacterium]|nr:CocE/NonD family hydrolase [Pseudomonadota bacterium]
MTRIVSRFPRKVRKIETAWIPMPDGVRLAATIWLPEDAEHDPVPAVLEFIPYRRRDFTAAGDALHHPYMAGHGYAAVRCDLRGTGDSEGLFEDEYSRQELDDGFHVLAWLAAQPWCSGTTGMMGISWGGFNCLQVAALRPPSLKAVYSVCSTDDRYADDVHYMGGVLLNNNLNWGATATTMGMRPPDPAVVGDGWFAMWMERLDKAPNLVADWMKHQTRDGQWKHGSVCEDYAAIEAAVYAVGGWADGYTNTVPRLVAGLRAPCRALVGPWTHAYPWRALPGPAINGLKDLCRWWDHWLKGIDTGMMKEPRYRVWMQDSVPPATSYAHRPGRWVAEDSWPSANVTARRFHLNSDGLGGKARRETALLHRSPVIAGGSHGDWCPYGYEAEMPDDQRAEDGMSLCFDTPPLSRRTEILGAPVLELDIASDKPLAQLYVRLCDVAADGASTRVTYGVLNLTHRNGHEAPEPLEPGRRYRVRVQMNDIAHAFPRGNRIRATVQTAAWPLLVPSPEVVGLTLFTGASTLDLPVRGRRAEDARLPALGQGEHAAPLELAVKGAPRRSRTSSIDHVAGEHTIRMLKDRGHYTIQATGTELAGRGIESYRIVEGTPLSARAEVTYHMALRRGPEWDVTIDTHFALTATAHDFLLTTEAEACSAGVRVWNRSWTERIPRNGT